jgi:hypothetical protein
MTTHWRQRDPSAVSTAHGKDFEMDVFTEEEVRVFCKRTKQIEDLEKRLRDELEKKAEAKLEQRIKNIPKYLSAS